MPDFVDIRTRLHPRTRPRLGLPPLRDRDGGRGLSPVPGPVRHTTGRRVRSSAAGPLGQEQALAAAAELRDRFDLEAGIVTLDKDGMALAHRDGRLRRSSRRGRGRCTTSPAPATW